LLAATNKDERMGFLKRLLRVFPVEELDTVKGIVRKVRRREKKKTGTVSQPSDVSQPVPVSADQPAIPWWKNWTDSGKCMAMDAEKVHVPENPDQCFPFIFLNNGLVNVTFKPKIEGMKIRYKELAGIVSVCDYSAKPVMNNVKIFHKPYSYLVNSHTYACNGITFDSLKDGLDINTVRANFSDLLIDNLCVTIRGENDFNSLGIAWGDYDTFDLNSHWYRTTLTNSKESIGLNDIYKKYFHRDLQAGFHDSFNDARGTMRIFKIIYPTEKRYEMNCKTSSYPYDF